MPNNKITSFMEVNQIFSFKDVFISSSKYNQLKDKPISLNKLEEYSILMLEEKTTTRRFFADLTAKFDVDLTPEVELCSVDLLIEMARIGLGISFVPNYCISNNTDLFKLNIKEKIPQRNLAVVTNENIPFSTASKKFMELLLDN
jgi:DNA-binding transcriptional LysR family regulator